MIHRLSFLVAMGLAATASAAGTPTLVRTVEGITEYKLDNGLTLLLVPDATQSTVTVNITYLVGSRHEGYGETGMAHLLEHMMFKGTPRHRNVLKLVQSRGGNINGTTWVDRTNYYETLQASNENLVWALDLEADRMRNASISKEDLATEFSVVRNEFEMGENSPDGVLLERMLSTAYLWHNYGKSTIGSRQDIERVQTESLRAFYDKYYQPDNAVLVVAGKFDEKLALQQTQKAFGVLKKPKRALGTTYTVEPVQDGERHVVLRRTGDLAVVNVMYHTVGGADPRFPALEAALDILGREGSGRLYKSLVETKLASAVGGFQFRFRDPSVVVFGADVRDAANLDKVETAIVTAIEGLAASNIEPAELERWRAGTLKQLELLMANSTSFAVVLSEAIAIGDWRMLYAYRDRVRAVTPDDVKKAAALFFKASNRTAGRFVPTKDPQRAPLVEAGDAAAAVAGLDAKTDIAKGEDFVASLDNIEKRTTRGELKGGLKTAFLPKKTRGGKVILQLHLHFGDEKSLQNVGAIPDLTADMLERGTASKTFQQIQDLKDQLKANIRISGAANGVVVSIETLRDQLGPAIDLAAEILTKPSFPAAELEIIRQEQLAALEQKLQDPSALAQIAMTRAAQPWPKGDPRETLTLPDTIAAVKKVTLADVQAFYRDFYGADHGELAIVGDFDPAVVGPQVERLLGTWKSKKPYARLQDKLFDVAGQSQTIDTKDKEMANVFLSQGAAMRSDDPDYPAWLIAGKIFGGDTGSRIWMRLREKEGLSYGAWGYTYAQDEDPVAVLGAGAIVAPQNLAKARASLLEEVNRIAEGTVTAEELARAKDAWVKEADTRLNSDGAVSAKLARGLYLGRTLEWDKKQREQVKAVKTDDVARVAKKHIQPKKLIVVEAGDMSRAK